MRDLSRRDLLAGASAFVATGARAESLGQPNTLAGAAAKAGLIYGASIDHRSLAEEDAVALKHELVRRSPDAFWFEPADAIADFARRNGKAFRGHTLVWNDNAPDWMKRLSRAEIEREFDRWLETSAARYAGRMHSWDVVNEPFWPMQRQPGGWRDGPWYQAMGPAYIERAFRRVRAIDPAAKLTLNEAQTDTNHEWGRQIRPLLRDLVKRLLDAGVPIDAVGLQTHLRPAWPHDHEAVAAYAQSIADLGVDIYVTELDVDDRGMPRDIPERDRRVAEAAGASLRAMMKVDRLRLVTTWQLSDRHSWYREPVVGGRLASQARPLPFDDRMERKAMRDMLISVFESRVLNIP